jgi:hypothetical protein
VEGGVIVTADARWKGIEKVRVVEGLR